MQFTLNEFELNLTSGLITHQGQVTNIRAKTLLVLTYLITHKNRIVTKQELLTSIWHDVIVQEQVLVQSIKEIRDLLGRDVIKTYSRQGYQWTAELIECPPKSHDKKKSVLFYSMMFLLLIVTVFSFNSFYGVKSNDNLQNKFIVGFFPVNNDMPDNIHNWVPLEGMDYLSHTLKQNPHFTVIENNTLLAALEINENTDASTTFKATNTPKKFALVQKQLSSDLLVQTSLQGYPQDFFLQYTFHLKHNVERGVILSDNVKVAFDQLTDLIQQRYGDHSAENAAVVTAYKSDFSNEAFTRGMGFYNKREYQKAIPLFTSALQDNPELLAARRSLAASYVNSGNVEQGIALMRVNIEQAKNKSNHREEIRSNLMLGVLLINWHETAVIRKGIDGNTSNNENLVEAEGYIGIAKTLAAQYQDKLFMAYAYEELGKIRRLQQQYDQAAVLQQKALKLHQTFRGKYGQTASLIELARVAAAQQDYASANNYFQQANNIAFENGVATNQVTILLAQADVEQLQELSESANIFAKKAMKIAQSAQSDFLITRVSAWLNNNNYYEIN
jgi:DNA-binding winged helix-turn-helix (wHTH) protein